MCEAQTFCRLLFDKSLALELTLRKVFCGYIKHKIRYNYLPHKTIQFQSISKEIEGQIWSTETVARNHQTQGTNNTLNCNL